MKNGFLNPYQFIPFPEHKNVKYEGGVRHTGVIEYQITTKTPLFIPNTSNDDAFRLLTNEADKKTGKIKPDNEQKPHLSQDFYSYQNLPVDGGDEKSGYLGTEYCQKPVIPGSELRGMVRSIYETLTGSCMGVLNADEYPVKRTSETFQPGLLHKTAYGYELFEAEDYLYREPGKRKTYRETKFGEGQRLFFAESSVDTSGRKPVVEHCQAKKTSGAGEGYLIKGMDSPSGRNEKKNAHLFVMKGRGKKFTLAEEDIDRLQMVLKSYQEQPDADPDSYKEYEKALRNFADGKGEEYFPVYYSVLRQTGQDHGKNPVPVIYLAPACYTKELSHHSVGDLAGEMKPCEELEKCCPACDLFGMTGKTNETAMASRIRFADAVAEEKNDNREYYSEVVTLQTLGGPKLGNTDFYLNRPTAPDGKKADFWTYDYYIAGGNLYLTPGTLRGRKYYWHQPEVSLPKNVTRTTLNKTVRPVKNGIIFTGKLYFDGISELQLNQLLWILDGGSPDTANRLIYKLGNGKPLGLGSVELSLVSKTERMIQPVSGGIRYTEDITEKEILVIPKYDVLGFDRTCKKDFFLLSAFTAAEGMYVTYPVVDEQAGQPVTEGYRWFVENHAVYKDDGRTTMLRNRTQMKTSFELPELREFGKRENMAALLLPYSQKSAKTSGNASRRSASTTGNAEFLYRKTYEGTVEGTNKQKTALLVDIGASRCVQVHITSIKKAERVSSDNLEQKFPTGTRIKICYNGRTPRNGKEYDEFLYKGRLS